MNPPTTLVTISLGMLTCPIMIQTTTAKERMDIALPRTPIFRNHVPTCSPIGEFARGPTETNPMTNPKSNQPQ